MRLARPPHFRLKPLLLAIGLVAGGGSAHATSALGVAGGFNVFLFGNSNQTSDTQGRIAVGGNATFTNMPVGDLTYGSEPTLVVGGDLTYTNATLRPGSNIVVGGNASLGNLRLDGNLSAGGSVTLAPAGQINGNVTYGSNFGKTSSFTLNGSATQGSTTLPVDFAAARGELTALSAAQVDAADPTAGLQWGALMVNAGGAAPGSTSFFNVSADSFNHAYSGFSIFAPAGATVVINVAGSSLSMPNTGFSSAGGITLDHVLFNLYEATSLTFQGSAHGSFLAPLADVTAGWGGFNGTLIANSLSGAGGAASGLEFHVRDFGSGPNTLFSGGGLRDVTAAVPEPSSLALMVAGVGALGAQRRRRMAARARSLAA
ncbi:choice-of-anchor A family protein [Derxia gummosa]|uniref:Choice-of-anchor A family protein n=1 Tax=Derxia gummosa DSM 723 TaxID=1121388 RepID=A0A8B6X5B9_9BURK|nr:choice-of-anchor A family protein [Derxia gummosa]